MKVELRVKTKQEFQKVIKGSKVINSTYVLYFIKNEFDHPRFGISASKKLGNAVIRSTVRRRVRGILQMLIKENDFANLDYVIIVRKPFLEKEFSNNKNELNTLFQLAWRKMNEKNN